MDLLLRAQKKSDEAYREQITVLMEMLDRKDALFDRLEASYNRSTQAVFNLSTELREQRKKNANLETQISKLKHSLENYKKALNDRR